jgi:hypothetical protein
MLDKHFLQSFLRVNTSERMSDAEVREVLIKAGWGEHEIAAGLALLRNKAMPVEESKQSFRPDLEFSSEQLSALLGVDISIDPHALTERQAAAQALSPREVAAQAALVIGVIVLSLGLAIGGGIFALFMLELGPFAK